MRKFVLPGFTSERTMILYLSVFKTQYKPMYTHLNVVSYPRYPGKDPVTLTPMILEKKIPKDGSNGFDKQIVIYAALAQVVF